MLYRNSQTLFYRFFLNLNIFTHFLYANNTKKIKWKKIKVCMPDCPISAVPKAPSPGWNLSPFTHCTVWIMKYLFILCVKSWLPWRGSCAAPDGERPIGYDWDAVKLWTHELFAISWGGAGGGSCHTILHHRSAGRDMSVRIGGLWETKAEKYLALKRPLFDL